MGYISQDRFFVFLQFELFLVFFDGFFVIGLYVFVNMRVVFDQFFVNGIQGIGDVESFLFISYFSIKYYMQE